MQISTQDLGQATLIRDRILKAADQIKGLDNAPDVDLDPRPGEVKLTAEALAGKGKPGVFLPGHDIYKDEVTDASVSFDPKTQQVRDAHISYKEYYDSSYGRSAENVYHLGIENRTEKDGFLGLFGTPQPRRVYTEKLDEYWNTNNHLATVKVDPASGNIVGYQYKEYAETFGQALKDVVTTPAGIGLTVTAGLLFGLPGTLGYALGGPLVGVAAAGATALALAYYKTRHW